MKKRMLALLSCLALLITLLPAALAAEKQQVVVLKLDSPWCATGVQVELIDTDNSLVMPVAERGHTLVPVGQIVKVFGGTSSWDLLTNRATFTLDGHSVVVEVGTVNAWVDGVPAAMAAAAQGRNNRTYVPLRFVLEKLGLTVSYQDGIIAVSRVAIGQIDILPETALLKEKLAQVQANEILAMDEYYYGAARQQQIYMDQMYEQFGMFTSFDPTITDAEQIRDEATGETWADYFTAQGKLNRRQVEALCADAEKNGYALSAQAEAKWQSDVNEMKRQVRNGGWSSFDAYLVRAYGKHVNENVYVACQRQAALASEYENAYADSLAFTQEELLAYAVENPGKFYSYDFLYYYISGSLESKYDSMGEWIEPTDSEVEIAAATAKAKADALVSGVRNAKGDKSVVFNKLVKNAVGETSGYADPVNNPKTGVLGNDFYQYAPYFDWLSAPERQAGDIEVIESGSGYYVVLFLKRGFDDTPTMDVRHILIQAEAPNDDPETYEDESRGMPSPAALEAARAQTQKLLDEFNALPDADRTAETFGIMANRYSADGGSNTRGGLYRYVSQGEMVPEFDAWCFDSVRRSGDTGLVANVAEDSSYYGYHVMYYVGHNGPKWQKIAEEELHAAAMETWLNSLLAQ